MASGGFTIGRPARTGPRGSHAFALLGLALASTSCVPLATVEAPQIGFAALDVATPARAAVRPVAFTVAASPGPVAPGFVFHGRTPTDGLRALDCLAQAIYYEARSESEAGQRAVAQVVVNRVRHPAWPNSVCGVVYQGPMRTGGGCQFTFTCDGSLDRAPQGADWGRARMIAAEMLAGRSYAPVGLSTHYHTQAVSPSWGPRLAQTTVIGAHIFYRLPGAGGLPRAFAAAYTGSEPVPNPTRIFFRTAAPLVPDFAALTPTTAAEIRTAVAIPSDIPQDARWTATNLPESTVREEYRQSGQWRTDAPTAMTGAR